MARRHWSARAAPAREHDRHSKWTAPARSGTLLTTARHRGRGDDPPTGTPRPPDQPPPKPRRSSAAGRRDRSADLFSSDNSVETGSMPENRPQQGQHHRNTGSRSTCQPSEMGSRSDLRRRLRDLHGHAVLAPGRQQLAAEPPYGERVAANAQAHTHRDHSAHPVRGGSAVGDDFGRCSSVRDPRRRARHVRAARPPPDGSATYLRGRPPSFAGDEAQPARADRRVAIQPQAGAGRFRDGSARRRADRGRFQPGGSSFLLMAGSDVLPDQGSDQRHDRPSCRCHSPRKQAGSRLPVPRAPGTG